MTQTIFITGASGGVGQATARLFLRQGWHVVATARRLATLGTLADHAQVTPVALDVADPESVDNAVAEVLAQHPQGMNVLVNNAGIGVGGPLEAVSDAALREIFATNLFGAAAMIRALLPGMREQGQGIIVNVGSVAGRVAIPYLSPYVASKFALEGLSEALQYELAPHGIRIKLIEPGGIRTAFKHRWFSLPAYEPRAEAVHAMMDAGTTQAPPPEDVAKAIWRAVSDPSPRLRYASNGGAPLLALRRLLPDRALAKLLGSRLPKV